MRVADKSLEQLNEEWRNAKMEYGKIIDERIALLADGNFTELTRQNSGLDWYFPAEKEALKKAEDARWAVIEKIEGAKRKRVHGDNGCYLCLECNGLFEHLGYKHKLEVSQAKDRESFSRCEQHKDRKSIGKIRLHEEGAEILGDCKHGF